MDNWESGYIWRREGRFGLRRHRKVALSFAHLQDGLSIGGLAAARADAGSMEREALPQVLEGLPRPGGPSSFLATSSDTDD